MHCQAQLLLGKKQSLLLIQTWFSCLFKYWLDKVLGIPNTIFHGELKQYGISFFKATQQQSLKYI